MANIIPIQGTDKLRDSRATINNNFNVLNADVVTLSAAGVGTLLNNRVSGLVNAGVDVTLGNLKVRMSTSGNRSLQVSTVSGTYSVTGSGTYSNGGSIAGSTIQSASPRTINTTPAYLNSGYNFTLDGATDTWVIMDASNMILRNNYGLNLVYLTHDKNHTG